MNELKERLQNIVNQYDHIQKLAEETDDNFDKMVESVSIFRAYLDGSIDNLSEDDLLNSLNKFISAYQPIQRVFQAIANIKF